MVGGAAGFDASVLVGSLRSFLFLVVAAFGFLADAASSWGFIDDPEASGVDIVGEVVVADDESETSSVFLVSTSADNFIRFRAGPSSSVFSKLVDGCGDIKRF